MRTVPPRALGLRLLAIAVLALDGCSARLTDARRSGEIAVIDVGSTVVRRLDGQPRRGGTFDVSTFEVAPGRHELALVFALPARTLGLKALPAQDGIGECVLEFEARAGRRYYLVARPLGDANSPRWSGDWEAWARDPAVASDDDVIARCRGAEPPAPPMPAAAAAQPAAAQPAPAGAAPMTMPMPVPLPPPGARALRIGAWRLPDLSRATSADLAATATVIGAGYDVLDISPALDPGPLLAALGAAWAASATADATIFYRRDLVRPCTAAATAAPCLESIDAASGRGRSLLLIVPPAGAPP